MKSLLPCSYTNHSINYKNGFVTTCPQTSEEIFYRDGSLPSEFINSEGFKKNRLQLINGQWPDGCRLCKHAERDGLTSMRYDRPEWYDESLVNTETGEVALEAIKHIELKYNNSCNMACLHCDSVFSSQWESRLKRYQPTRQDKLMYQEQLLKQRHGQELNSTGERGNSRLKITMDETKLIIQDLIDNFPNLERYDCSGGEPLKQKEFWYSIEALLDHPNRDNLEIFFYTNFNADFDVDRLNNILSQYKHVTMNISVDAGTNIYSYFRDGSWDTLLNNINRYRATNNNTTMKAVVTYSVFQLMDIYNVMTSVCSLPVDLIDAAPVHVPPYLNPALAMHKFEFFVAEELDKTREALENLDREKDFKRFAIRALDQIEDYVYQYKPEKPDVFWEQFLHYRKTIDKLFKKDFNEAFSNYQYDEHDRIIRVKGL